MKHMIYADHAATTKLAQEAFEAMVLWLTEEYGNASQPYSFARKPKKALREARETIAGCINAQPEEIFFTSGGTESDNWAIKGTLFRDGKKRAAITSAIEHHAVLNACAAAERLGYPVTYLLPDGVGMIAPDALEGVITPQTGLVSIMLSNNEIGTIEPIKALAAATHKHGVCFHTDAVQAVGHVKIDVQDLDVDMLSASAHKFNGPKGVGFLYVRKGTNIARWNDGGSQEFGLRAGTENVAAIVGMAKALELSCSALYSSTERLLELEGLLLSRLNSHKLDYVRSGAADHVPGNVSLSFRGTDGETLLHRLDLMGICVSTGSACDSVNTQISHVLKAIRLDEDYARGTIRVSLGSENTADEVQIIADSIARILKQ